DGIRDLIVTGVQTCALPIYAVDPPNVSAITNPMSFRLNSLVIAGELHNPHPHSVHGWIRLRGHDGAFTLDLTGAPSEDLRGRSRSEERRVGREWRSRLAAQV